MGNNFANALSSKMNFTDLKLLLRTENPDRNELLSLITTLAEQESYDILRTLLELLRDESHPLSLQVPIYASLLTHALQQSNKPEAIRLLRELGLLLRDDNSSWADVISRLVSWINDANNEHECTYLLQNLPEMPRELLFERLFEMVEGSPLWLDSFIDFVANFGRMNQDHVQHVENLASKILLSQASLNDSSLKKLSLLLTTNTLIAITFQLRATAATYNSEIKENELPRFTEKRQIYLAHYKTLLTALTVRATASPADYQIMVKDNSELANLLMTKRLQTLKDSTNQHLLIKEILTNPKAFNWDDSQFSNVAIEHLLIVFAALPPEKLSLSFKDFFNHHSKKSISAVIHFLDLLFQKTNYDSDKVLRCLNDNDDADHTLTINFITQSTNRTDQLTEHLLQRLDITQLINLSGHIVALKQVLQRETDPLLTLYCRVLCKKIEARSKESAPIFAWATALTQLPVETQDEFITAAFANFNKTSLQFMWLTALLSTPCNKSKLFSQCKAILKNLSLVKQEKIVSLFAQEELLHFYLFMSRNHAQEQDFSCFETLFANPEKQSDLLYFLLNTPITEQPLLNKLFLLLQDKNLITLIEQLISKSAEDSAYNIKLEQTLLYFCSRLQLTWDDKQAIHQWINCDKKVAIAEHLIASPQCLHSLASRSSTFQNLVPSILQGIVSYDAGTDLKLRAARIFSLVQLDEDKAQKIALRLLSHFRHDYKGLQLLFVNLAQAEVSFNAQGKATYTCFLKACFKLLKPHETANEEECLTFLTTKLGTPHCFDAVVARLASNLSENEDACQSAHYLTQIEANALVEIDESILASILLQSTEQATAENWKKVSLYLNDAGLEKTICLVKTLITQCKHCDNNPLLMDKARLFIITLADFTSLLPLLDNEELQWLVKECPSDILIIEFPEWLDVLLSGSSRNTLDVGALLALLPSKLPFLDSLYQRPTLVPFLHSLFIQFSNHPDCTNHLMALFQPISSQSEDEKRLFITRAQKEIEPQSMTMVAAPILNMLLLSLTNLKASKAEDRKLIDNQLHFFTRLVVNPSIDAMQLPQFTRSLQQLVLNIFALLSSSDDAWTEVLLKSKCFAASVLVWLKTIEERTIPLHPFTQLLIDNASLKIHPELVNSDSYQFYLHCLLLNPPSFMTSDQFLMLFMMLNPDNKKSLARHLLPRSTLDNVQWASLAILSQVLEPTELYKLYKKSDTPFVFVDLLFRHPSGVGTLQEMQKNELLESINSAKQLLRILDSQSPVTTKFTFVDAIFNYLEQTQTNLLTWLLRLHVDAQTLAALANFTRTPKHQQLLKEIITKDDYRKKDIQYYVQNPDIDMVINKQGLLYQFLEEAWLNPWSGWLCHPQLVSVLDRATIEKGLKAQVKCLNQVQQLEKFYEPLSLCQETPRDYITAARWISRLSLLSDGLLDLLDTYRNTQDEELKATIEKSELYALILAPLLQRDKVNCSTAILSNDFRTLLADIQPAHAMHQEYLQQVAVIEHFSSPRLYGLFNPSSYFARIKKNAISPLQSEEIDILANASAHHCQWITARKVIPSFRFNEILRFIVKNPALLQDLSLQKWLFASLFSPLADETTASLMQQIVGFLEPPLFAREIEQIHRDLIAYENVWDELGRLAHINNIEDMLRDLLVCTAAQLTLYLNAAELASCFYLSALLALVLKAQRLHMNSDDLKALLPLSQLTHGFELDWIHNDVKNLTIRALQLSSRCNELAVAGYKYHQDKNDNIRLNTLVNSFLGEEKNSDKLACCLNSYERAFEKGDPVADIFLETLSKFLAKPSVANNLVHHLSPSLIKRIVARALQDIEPHNILLQRIIQAGWGEECRELLSAYLQQSLSIGGNSSSEIPIRTLALLSPAQLAHLRIEDLRSLFIVQRLFFLIDPVEELSHWQQNANNIPPESRALLAADASILATFTYLEKRLTQANENDGILIESKRRLTYWFRLLQKKTYISFYYANCHSLTIEEPAAFYHWLCLQHFLSPNLICLSTQFIAWLQKADISQEITQRFLSKLLADILHKNLLIELCTLIQEPPPLEEGKSEWLFTSMIQLHSESDFLINTIITACTWKWLAQQIRTSQNRLKLLTAALNEKSQYQRILHNEQTILDFVALLNHCHFSPDELIDLLYKIPHKALRSLIAFHLLTRDDYLQNISGRNFLLDEGSSRRERRLKPLTHHLHLKSLPVSLLQQLSPEAAADIFCSVPLFHLLNEEIVMALFERVGGASDAFIKYWLYYYATMPNSHEPLSVLFNKFMPKVLAILKKMPHEQCEPILFIFIKHIHRLNQLPEPALLELTKLCAESHLLYAIKLYLHGGQSENLKNLIVGHLKSYLSSTPLLSAPIIHLLVRLNEDPAFDGMKGEIGSAIGSYLRNSALSDCSIFYDDDRINIKRMQELIPLSRVQEPGMASRFFVSLWNLNFLSGDQESAAEAPRPENPLISLLEKRFETIKTFNYFLIHFEGNIQKLKECLDDYLTYMEQNKRPSQEITDTSWLTTRKELPIETRDMLFECFLSHSSLVHGKIALHLLKFNAEKVLLHFGKHHSYERLLTLCNNVLPLLGKKNYIASLVQKAKAEAEFESKISQVSGFLASLRIRLKRCWFYGWNGWFSPKSPRFVTIGQTISAKEPNSNGIVMDRLKENSYKIVKLESLLEKIQANSSFAEIIPLYQALTLYECEPHNESEYAIRTTIDALYEAFQRRAHSEPDLGSWLYKHQQLFITNRYLLIALNCRYEGEDQLDQLLEKASNGPGQFYPVVNEIRETRKPERIQFNAPSQTPAADGVLGGIVTMVSSFWTSPAPSEPPPKEGWLRGWGFGLF